MAKPLLYDGLLSASHQSIITGDSARSSSFTLLEGDPIFPNQSYYTVSAINEACFARTYSTAYGEGSPMAFVSPPNSRGQRVSYLTLPPGFPSARGEREIGGCLRMNLWLIKLHQEPSERYFTQPKYIHIARL